jgi:DNA-binding NtrC family response regulator
MSQTNGDSTVLLVEDQELVRGVIRSMLERMGHKVVEAGSGDEAMTLASGITPQLLLTDIVMPGMSCERLIKDVRALHPEVKVMIISGHENLRIEGYPVLRKPFAIGEFQACVAKALEEP